MTNNLSQLKRDLKSFAKKCKDFKYTDSALFTFLLNGMLISAGELSVESKDSGISNQVNLINSSIGQMRKDFKHARSENNKLIKDTNLELTQLMEQGDHVTKSPWSNWQIGANDFYNDWHGHFKGRGNRVQDGKFYQRDATMEKYNYQLKNLSTYGATRLKLNSDNMEKPVEIQIDASLRTLSIDKPAPTFVPTTPSGGLPPFDPLMVTPPIINPKNVNISQPPQSPTINVGVEDVPDDLTGYNKDGNMVNNSLLSQLDLTGGSFNLFFHGGGQPYDYSFINASENTAYTPSTNGIYLPSSDSGTSPKVAFFGMGGKLLAEIPSNVTVNAVSNVSGDVNVLYYMGNNNDASNPESKLIHRGTTNLYGNDLLVVKIDNVSSNDNITFVNEGKINGYINGYITLSFYQRNYKDTKKAYVITAKIDIYNKKITEITKTTGEDANDDPELSNDEFIKPLEKDLASMLNDYSDKNATLEIDNSGIKIYHHIFKYSNISFD